MRFKPLEKFVVVVNWCSKANPEGCYERSVRAFGSA
ncbi:hypothetical protein ABIC03_007821 [Bradyrhizobium sp. RT6a]